MARPQIGMTTKVERLGICTIVKVRPAGTIDVVDHKGNYYRISGLDFTEENHGDNQV